MGGPGGPPPGGGGAGLAGGPSPGGGQGGLGASGSVGAPNGGPEAGDKEDTGPLDVWVRVTLAGRPKPDRIDAGRAGSISGGRGG